VRGSLAGSCSPAQTSYAVASRQGEPAGIGSPCWLPSGRRLGSGWHDSAYWLDAGPALVEVAAAGVGAPRWVAHVCHCAARPGSQLCVCGSWRGLFQRDRQPGIRQLTVRRPWPGSASEGSQSHGDLDTMTLPGPQVCPCSHARGYDHQRGRSPNATPRLEHASEHMATTGPPHPPRSCRPLAGGAGSRLAQRPRSGLALTRWIRPRSWEARRTTAQLGWPRIVPA
jgi:hypothetical protein